MPSKKLPYKEIAIAANDIRKDIIEMLTEAGSGHVGGSLGLADILATLYYQILEIDPKNPTSTNRDRLVLSNGHVCPALYATLGNRGFFSKTKLQTLRKLNSPLEGHPVYGLLPGIENSSGSLGQGFSQALGMAIAAKMDNKNYRVYCITGDGELNEGQIWETCMMAPNRNITNFTWIIDRNNIQIDGTTEDIMPLENLRDKLESFNWYVIEIDGHNIEEIVKACEMAKSVSQRPTAIIAHTIPGKGVSFMEYKFSWHGKVPSKEEAQKAVVELNALEGIINKYDK